MNYSRENIRVIISLIYRGEKIKEIRGNYEKFEKKIEYSYFEWIWWPGCVEDPKLSSLEDWHKNQDVMRYV